MSLPKLAVAFTALAFLGVGLAFLARPVEMAAVIQLDLGGIVSASDIRAVYGGLNLGIAGFLLWTWRAGVVRIGLVAAAVFFAGLLLGRAVSLVADGVPESPGFVLMGFEAAGLVLVALGLARSDAPRPQPD